MLHIDGCPQGTSGLDSVKGNTFFANDDIEHAVSLNPFTHIYMFDVGFPCELHYSLANKFNCSLYAIYLISYQPPKFIIDEFGFKVLLMHQFSTRMNGTYKY
jgi:hypothetical protein